MQKAWILAIAVVVGGASAATILMVSSDDSLPFEDVPFLQWRPGEVHVYDVIIDGEKVGRQSANVMAPRMVWSQHGEPRLGMPVVVRTGEDVAGPADAYVTDVMEGGLLLSVDACLVDSGIPCQDTTDSTALVQWGACRLGSYLAPVDRLRVADLAHDEWLVKDEVFGTEWTFDITSHGNDRFELVRRGPSPAGDCGVVGRLLLDARLGRVLEYGEGGSLLVLTSVSQGGADAVGIGGFTPRSDVLVAERGTAGGPYPPGADVIGWPQWRLPDAWGHAIANAERLQQFVLQHPEAFVFAYRLHEAEVAVVPEMIRVNQSVRTIEFDVLSADGTMVRVNSSITETGGVPTYESTAADHAAPAQVPDGFQPPDLRLVDMSALAPALARSPVPAADAPQFSVVFEGGRAAYSYFVPLGFDEDVTGTNRFMTEYLNVSPLTGRITDGIVSREAVLVFFAGGP